MRDAPPPRRRWTLRLVVCAALLALIATFVAQNYETVEVRVLFWSADLRLAWTVLIGVVVGSALAWLLPRIWR